MAAPKKPLRQRIADADALCNRWLADGNAYAEAGRDVLADKCYTRAQYWKDRYNLLTNQAEKAAPRA
jgi:hypothetical protein